MSHNKIKILDIGCGKEKVPGAIGVDFNTSFSADVIHDLNLFPYPFKDEEFDKIHISNTLFLLENPIKVMEEIFRICKPNGLVVVIQPYFRSSWSYVDPMVKNFATVYSFTFYDPDNPICLRYNYSSARFATEKIIFDDHLHGKIFQGGNSRFSPGIIRKFITMLANKYPRMYEASLSHFFPLDQISFLLRRL